MLDATTERKLLGLLGLGVRGRLVIAGVDRVREAAKRGVLRFAVIGADASRHSLAKVEALLEARGVRTVKVSSTSSLGSLLGKESVAVVGIIDAKLAQGIRSLVDPVGDKQSLRRKG